MKRTETAILSILGLLALVAAGAAGAPAGETRQVLCVTHLPQVASQAHRHYRVAKLSNGTTTETRIESGMTITTKTCQVGCTSDGECRWKAEELSGSPWHPGCGEWRGIPRGDGGAYICGDERNYTP